MSQSPTPERSTLTRRRVFAGVGAAGALAAVAAVLPGQTPAPTPVAALPKTAPDTDGGYQLTEHVRRYYQTAKV
ncbi:formate dehydrogenase [uncultured Sphaerotilus sp.]|uniref:formate dehydrogenase n=1 Tax=uncultured Sphaerotilus sp. TaxID=474984 RepID=UPI0030CA1FF4